MVGVCISVLRFDTPTMVTMIDGLKCTIRRVATSPTTRCYITRLPVAVVAMLIA